MTLEKIRAALPKYIMLTRGKHFVKWGDEFLAPENYEAWRPIVRGNEIGSLYDKHSCWMRRPIPSHILDNQAFWVLFDKLADRSPQSLGGVTLELERGLTDYQNVRVLIHNVRGLFFGHTRRFSTENAAYEAMENLGGARKVIENLSIGRLYDKWLLEQMEDV